MQTIFANYNLAAQSNGNSSGVLFEVRYTSTPIATTVSGTAETEPTSGAAGLANVYQINRPPVLEGSNPNAFAQTGPEVRVSIVQVGLQISIRRLLTVMRS